MHVLEVKNVSKRFRLGSGSIKHMLLDRQASIKRDFWALKDVSFTVERGTALGIVGHNGSGKSTILKLLTRIMNPTSGEIHTRGRIAALIEVGAGFHTDLTGRENVYLNGSIMGLSRHEIRKKFDAIVDFAGMEKFIDTPVKRYSSGMYTRLGFSIAAHIDPDILLVDEVLAVGDTQFQQKCIRKMMEFIGQGGTLIFVSHYMDQMAQVCKQCVWLDHGQLLYQGETQEAVDRYLELVVQREKEELEGLQNVQPEDREIIETERLRLATANRSRLIDATLLDADGKPQTSFRAAEPMRVRIQYHLAERTDNPVVSCEIVRNDGLVMFGTNTYDHRLQLGNHPLDGEVAFEVPYLCLNEGSYSIRLKLYLNATDDNWSYYPEDIIEDAAKFRVSANEIAYGCAYMSARWEASFPQPPAAMAAAREMNR